MIKTIFVALTMFVCAGAGLISSRAADSKSGIDLNLARQYFREAREMSERDGGRLWGVPLYGSMIFVDPERRSVVANQADAEGRLRREGEVFVGTLPSEVNASNTATVWAGVKWTMVLWPLPEDKQPRTRLMAHELFHRVQDDLHLEASNPSNKHLDSEQGRVWLRLEWRALERALQETGDQRRKAVADALCFRSFRRTLFPDAAEQERLLETNEGLAEYTGFKLSGRSAGQFAALAGDELRDGHLKRSFVRSFAYVSGPAFGFLLDETGPGWRKSVKAGDDLAELLRKRLSIKRPPSLETEAKRRAGDYDGEEIFAAESRRETLRRTRAAEYQAKLIDGPVLILPLAENVNYSFNPNTVFPFNDIGTVYPTLRISDDWGVLEVSGGALMVRENGRLSKIQVAAPPNAAPPTLEGPGWKLELKPGWEFVPGTRKGDWTVKKREFDVGNGDLSGSPNFKSMSLAENPDPLKNQPSLRGTSFDRDHSRNSASIASC